MSRFKNLGLCVTCEVDFFPVNCNRFQLELVKEDGVF